MITIRLLGGAKKAMGGRSSIQFEKPSGTVSEILRFLQDASSEATLLNPTNLIIAVNGTDSSALKGPSTEVKSGDVVTVVTVVHGGSYVLDGGIHVSIRGARRIDMTDIGEFLDKLRRDNEGVTIQAADAGSVYGVEHVLGVVSIVIEAKRRGIMIANKIEAELLLRLACTRQISEAIARIGLKTGSSCCVIAFSENAGTLARLERMISDSIESDDTVIFPTVQKKLFLAKRMGLDPRRIRQEELLNHLIENAAVIVK